MRFGILSLASVALALVNPATQVQSATQPETIWVSATNWTPRYLTNVIKVSIPTNTFVDEYHTNWVRQKITNVLDVFRTNLMTDFQTNMVYVNAFRTNVQFAYQTNVKVFSLTNWETVLVMKTNWVHRPVTNVVEIELPAPVPVSATSATLPPSKPEPVAKAEAQPVAGKVDFSQKMEFELQPAGRSPKPDQIAIRLILKVTGESAEVLPVQEWRVDKVNGGAFMVGSHPEFTATLPAGTYKVLARARAEDGSLRSILGQVVVSADGQAQRSPASIPPSPR
jgi:hypothetical protein